MAAAEHVPGASAATVAAAGGALTRSVILSWSLRIATAAALALDAAVHWHNASAYDAVTATLSQGELFRIQTAMAVAVGLLVLVRPRRGSWVAALAVGGSALAAVLLYRYVDLGALGPLPDMYENTWQVPGKLLSADAEGAAVVLAGLGLLTHRGATPIRATAGFPGAGSRGEIRTTPPTQRGSNDER